MGDKTPEHPEAVKSELMINADKVNPLHINDSSVRERCRAFVFSLNNVTTDWAVQELSGLNKAIVTTRSAGNVGRA